MHALLRVVVLDDKLNREEVADMVERWLYENNFVNYEGKFWAGGIADYFVINSNLHRWNTYLDILHIIPKEWDRIIKNKSYFTGEEWDNIVKKYNLKISVVERIDDIILNELIQCKADNDEGVCSGEACIIIDESEYGEYITHFLEVNPPELLLNKWVVLVDFHY